MGICGDWRAYSPQIMRRMRLNSSYNHRTICGEWLAIYHLFEMGQDRKMLAGYCFARHPGAHWERHVTEIILRWGKHKLCVENGLTRTSGELYNISLHLAIALLSPP